MRARLSHDHAYPLTPTPMFKRSKTKPSQRTRATSPEDVGVAEPITVDDSEDPTTNEESSPLSAVKKFKDRTTKKSRLKSRLSFGAEEEEEEVSVSTAN